MIIIQILLAVISLPIGLHLLRILLISSPGHSQILGPIFTRTSSIALVGLAAFLVALLASGNFEPVDMPQRPGLQLDSKVLNDRRDPVL